MGSVQALERGKYFRGIKGPTFQPCSLDRGQRGRVGDGSDFLHGECVVGGFPEPPAILGLPAGDRLHGHGIESGLAEASCQECRDKGFSCIGIGARDEEVHGEDRLLD